MEMSRHIENAVFVGASNSHVMWNSLLCHGIQRLYYILAVVAVVQSHTAVRVGCTVNVSVSSSYIPEFAYKD